jgi:ubiquinone/menaquinone biosynthesis C-methylase UbiE/uncharacterized protein YbaR (Trm112 family)
VRRAILNILQCPLCRRGSLKTESEEADVAFGPVRCKTCEASFPLAEGILNLMGEQRPAQGLAQRALETPWVVRSYERSLRGALNRLAGNGMDDESRHVLLRSLLAAPTAPILDLGCGSGGLSRRLAREKELPPIVGMDVSWPMLEEARDQQREAAVTVDLLRAEAPRLPFQEGTLGAVILEGTLPLVAEMSPLLAEVSRVLVPGGRVVASTHVPASRFGALGLRALGLRSRGEDEIRQELAHFKFEQIERVKLPPLLVVKAQK